MNLSHIWRVDRGCATGFSRARVHVWAIATCVFLAAIPAGAGRSEARETLIVAYGDSLSAGFQLPPKQSFPAQLQTALRERGHRVRVVNASVSGDTAAAGLARLDWALPEEAHAVILELGANDALRGLDPVKTKAALDRIIVALKGRGIAVLLAGMRAPPNMGPEYTRAFGAIYPALAEKHDVLFYPFFLDGVAANPKLNLSDGMHPNGKGVSVIVDRILPDVERLIERAAADRKPRG